MALGLTSRPPADRSVVIAIRGLWADVELSAYVEEDVARRPKGGCPDGAVVRSALSLG